MNSKKSKSKLDDVNSFNESFIKGQIYKDVFSKKDLWKDLAKYMVENL